MNFIVPFWARILIVIALVGVVYSAGWVKGVSHQQDADAVAYAKARDASDAAHYALQGQFHSVSSKLEGEKDANAKSAPVIAVVHTASCMRDDGGSLPGHASHPGERDETPRSSAAAAIGEALKHDADRYPDCVSSLNAALDLLNAAQATYGKKAK